SCGVEGALPRLRRPHVVRRRRRSGRAPCRDVDAPDRERDEPRRHALRHGDAPSLGRRPRTRGTLAAVGRPRRYGRALGRSRKRAESGLRTGALVSVSAFPGKGGGEGHSWRPRKTLTRVLLLRKEKR